MPDNPGVAVIGNCWCHKMLQHQSSLPPCRHWVDGRRNVQQQRHLPAISNRDATILDARLQTTVSTVAPLVPEPALSNRRFFTAFRMGHGGSEGTTPRGLTGGVDRTIILAELKRRGRRGLQ